jgi:hypothetical protein
MVGNAYASGISSYHDIIFIVSLYNVLYARYGIDISTVGKLLQ